MTSIQMPQLGETIVEGTILKWLKQEGDAVAADEPLFEISTDKVDTEVPSPVAGTVTKLLVAEGATVPVGTAVMEIDDGTGAGAGVGSDGGGAAGAVDGTRHLVGCCCGARRTPADRPRPAAQAAPGPPAAAAAPAAPAPVAVAPSPVTVPDRGPRSQILSPIVRRLARRSAGSIWRPWSGPARVGGSRRPTCWRLRVGRLLPRRRLGVVVPATDGSRGGAGARRRHRRARARTSSRCRTSARRSPRTCSPRVNETARAWTMVEVNVEHLVRLRTAAKDGFQEKYGVKLTYLPMVTRATVDALREFPLVNSALRGRRHRDAAVREHGHRRVLRRRADRAGDQGRRRDEHRRHRPRDRRPRGARARAHQLQPDEVQGATFTITNPGPYGSLVSVPIINQPNAGILSLDAIQKRPVVVEETRSPCGTWSTSRCRGTTD